jgi:hypothetical protein
VNSEYGKEYSGLSTTVAVMMIIPGVRVALQRNSGLCQNGLERSEEMTEMAENKALFHFFRTL